MSEPLTAPDSAPDEDAWPVSFEAHQSAQRKRMAALSLEEKVDWLEDAHRLVLALQAGQAAKEELSTEAPLQDAPERAKLREEASDHDTLHNPD